MFEDLAINLAASVVYDFSKALHQGLSKKEMVQVAKRQLGVLPDKLHDFPDRYVEALVDFRFLKKEKVILGFFREESIQQVFYDYYYGMVNKRGNDTVLNESLHHCVEALSVGDDIKSAGVQVEAEIQQFGEVFRQKVQESRTLKEAELQQQLEALRVDGRDMKEALEKMLRWMQDADKTSAEINGKILPMDVEANQHILQKYVEKMYQIGSIGTAHFHIHAPATEVSAESSSAIQTQVTPARIQSVNRQIIRQQAPLRWYQRLFFRWMNKRTRREYALAVQGIFDAAERMYLLKSLETHLPLYFTDASGSAPQRFSKTFFQVLNKPENNGNIYLLLGETGTGKSTALLELFTRYALVPRQYSIVFANFQKDLEAVFRLPKPEEVILFLDGIDETPALFQDPDAFFTEVEHSVREFAKVIISCRTQFFKNKGDERSQTKTNSPKDYQKVYLELLSEKVVNKYIEKRYTRGKPEYIAAKVIVERCNKIFRRPLLLSFIPDMVKNRADFLFFYVGATLETAIGSIAEYEVYETILNKWLDREKNLYRNAEADYSRLLFEVSMKLALNIFYPEGRKYIYYADLNLLIEKHKLPIDEVLLRDRSLLRRNEAGYYNFAHRSFKEFFFAQLLYEGLIPEHEFPFDAYGDAETFYNQMGEIRYFQQQKNMGPKTSHWPGRIKFMKDSPLPRPLQVFCHLEKVPVSQNVWEVFSLCLGKPGLQDEHKACLVDIANYLVQTEIDTVSADYLESACNKYDVRIGDLIQAFFFCQTDDSYHFLHRSFAEYLCLRGLISGNIPVGEAARFPFHKLRFRPLFQEEIRWLQFLPYRDSVALMMDNYDATTEDYRQSGMASWYDYNTHKAKASFPDFFSRLERGAGRLCIRTASPTDQAFLNYIPFAEELLELDVSHCKLEGEISLAHFTQLKKLHLPGNPGLNLADLPASLQRITLSEKALVSLPPEFREKAVSKEAIVRKLAGAKTHVPETVAVAGGRYWMGSEEGDAQANLNEKPLHRVDLSDFSIGKYPVTVREFACFVRETGYVTAAEREAWTYLSRWNGNTLTGFLSTGTDWTCDVYGNPMDEAFARHPVIQVSWHDARAYCAWLSQQTGRTCRLPTEAEWEYAAASGQQSGHLDEYGYVKRGYEFAGSQDAQEVAWYGDKFIDSGASKSNFSTQAVGKLKPNALGLFDMSGNVNEWCEDGYDGDYYAYCHSEGTATNPGGPESGSFRVIRGGSWSGFARRCRAASRGYNHPGYRNDSLGFRLVFVP